MWAIVVQSGGSRLLEQPKTLVQSWEEVRVPENIEGRVSWAR